jgi:hypothetical protein
MRRLSLPLLLLIALVSPGRVPAAELSEARIYIEYNESGNDLGFHVFLDGEDWKSLAITNPLGQVVFAVEGLEGYAELGLTELFFEGAEPRLDEFPLEDLLELFPEGIYTFAGLTVDDEPITGEAVLSHDVPAGPRVRVRRSGDDVILRWREVTGPAEILPEGEIEIEGYQVLVESLAVTLDADARSFEIPEELLAGLEPGEVEFEVLAIDASGNQTITEGSFEWDGGN